MEKKKYGKPEIKVIKISSKNAVLGVCHSSPNMWPSGAAVSCKAAQVGCQTGA
jgi:hypothetical protein